MTVSKDWLKITVKDTGLGISEKATNKNYFPTLNKLMIPLVGSLAVHDLVLAISNSFSAFIGCLYSFRKSINLRQ
ncbi:MAG: hypothetical protein U1E91_01880 [Moraxella sp.]